MKESKINTVKSEILLDKNDDWLETSDDIVTVCTNENITHEERYEYRKKRIYKKHRLL